MTVSLVSLVAYHVLFDGAENRAALRIAVRDSSRAKDRAGGKRPCFRCMHDQVGKSKVMSLPLIAFPKTLPLMKASSAGLRLHALVRCANALCRPGGNGARVEQSDEPGKATSADWTTAVP